MSHMLGRLDNRRLADVPRLKELRRDQLEDALAFYQSVLREDGPLEPAVQFDVASAFAQVALIQHQLSQLERSKESFQRAVQLLEDLTARYPDVRDYRLQLAAAYNGLGCNYDFRDLSDPALPWLQKAQTLRTQLYEANPDDVSCQEALAVSYHNLAHHAQVRGDPESVDYYERALAIRKRLLERYPDEILYKTNAATDYQSLGSCYAASGQLDRAEAVYRQAEPLLRSIMAAKPQESDYPVMLAGLYANWAILARTGRQQCEPAARLATRAIDLTEEVLGKEPRHGLAREVCRNAHGERAYAYDGLRRYSEAVKDWDRIIELSEVPQRPRLRALRGWTLLHAGDYTAGAAAAKELAGDPQVSGMILYEAAKLAASAGEMAHRKTTLPTAQSPQLSEACADQAMAVLLRLQQSGYFDDKDQARDLAEGGYFPLLVSRKDFQKLLSQIAAKH
jgi:tetratricopeptide (TPR) repeat protein